MGHIIFPDEIDRIDLGDGDWVEIKHKMSYGNRQALVAHYMKLKGAINKQVEYSVDLESGNIMLLVLNIVAWSLLDKKGKPLPVTKETISWLDNDTGNKIADEIGKRNPVPKA